MVEIFDLYIYITQAKDDDINVNRASRINMVGKISSTRILIIQQLLKLKRAVVPLIINHKGLPTPMQPNSDLIPRVARLQPPKVS
jgi:hypothetical protein